ncbi:angiopoietin-related protein 4-like [Denticeps clupeoides]|uniref:Fibrinogen C-terminal domain-containing protein n=1 Tax=Denticeps clupeoides TaxID=299321 RepID=A0AAY4D7L5_9TELE|nr:angiopoietin-related protein 4-like [Denticeps clupeoides]
MKGSSPAKLVLLAAILVPAATGYPSEKKPAAAGREGTQHASWDDVNVLAHGLLQLGHGLKEHVDKTRGQVRELGAKLQAFDGSFSSLDEVTRHLQKEGEALKEKTRQLGQRQEQALNASAELQNHVEQLSTEGQSVRDRIGHLEKKVDNLQGSSGNHSNAHMLQLMLETQGRRIEELVEQIRQQKESLERQSALLHDLQAEVRRRKLNAAVQEKAELHPAEPPEELASGCQELFLRGNDTSGLHLVRPRGSEPFSVSCDMATGPGWTVIQNRVDGSVDFNRPWADYQNGFGSLTGEFWLGLDKLHALAGQGDHIMQLEFSDWMGESRSVRYRFRLDGAERNYALHLQPDGSEALQSGLATGTGLPFSTADRDHDQKPAVNCAQRLTGGWWFGGCGQSNLNGRYLGPPGGVARQQWRQAAFWKPWRGLRRTAMKMAPAA